MSPNIVNHKKVKIDFANIEKTHPREATPIRG